MTSLVSTTICRPMFCKSSKHARVKRLLEKAQRQMETSLDIRTLMRMQSLQTATTRVIFDKKHRPLLKQQKSARSIDTQSDSSADSVLYGSDHDQAPATDPTKDKNQAQQDFSSLDAPDLLSPRSSILTKGTNFRGKNIPKLETEGFESPERQESRLSLVGKPIVVEDFSY